MKYFRLYIYNTHTYINTYLREKEKHMQQKKSKNYKNAKLLDIQTNSLIGRVHDMCGCVNCVHQVCVNGLQSHPLFAWLKAASGVPMDISWNFSKFLVVGGNTVARYSHEVIYSTSSLRVLGFLFHFVLPIHFLFLEILLCSSLSR